MKSFLREAWPTLLWAVFILVLTSVRLPGTDWAPDRLPLDKAVHFGVYAVLGWAIAGTMGRLGVSRPYWVVAFIVGVAFAALDEWHQTWIPGRDPSVGDWIADTAGLLFGMTIHWRRDFNT